MSSQKMATEEPELVVVVSGVEICRSKCPLGVPVHELTPVARLEASDPTVVFRTSTGLEFTHELASTVPQGPYLHFCVRLHHGVAQVDCLLLPTEEKPEDSAWNIPGIRFQPFAFDVDKESEGKGTGRLGFFARGLHYAGTIDASTSTLSVICDNPECRRSFRLQFCHAGFAQLNYMYCTQGIHPLLWSAYESLQEMEKRLGGAPPCDECGGSFSYTNAMRCPHCKHVYVDYSKVRHGGEYEYYCHWLYGSKSQSVE